jgi:PAS domain S-box-containing protein
VVATDQAMLTRAMTLIASGASLRVVLDAIVRGVESDHPGMLCSILLLDEAGTHLRHGAAPSLPDFYNVAIDGVAIGPQVGSCGTAAYTGKRVIVSDIRTDPRWAAFKDLALRAGLASCWSEPIYGGGERLLGTFALYGREARGPTTQDIHVILAAAHLAAIAVERKQALDALEASEARAEHAAARAQASANDLETFFTVSQDLLCITDRRGVLIKLNAAWENLLGYPCAPLVGVSFLRLLHPDDVATVVVTSRKLRGAADALTMVTRFRCADGSYKHVEWRAGPSGERLYCVGRDVTERIKGEADLRAAKAEAEAANRAKSDFLANMSHEVRTPLNGVIGVVDALAHTGLTAAQREMVGLIQSSGATLERLVSDILDISKIEAGRLELEVRQFDLQHALASVLDVARIRADEKGLGFRVDYGASARGLFLGDCVRIKQILGNLLSNALKFTTEGTVSVSVEVLESGCGDQPARLALAVSDTGVGFDPAAGAALFERFSQADSTITRRFGGSGLGLAIIKALVEMMGGEIEATAKPGEGARFALVAPLPRSLALADYDRGEAEAPSPARDRAAPIGAMPDRPLRVLLAEDNLINQKVVELILAPYGVDLTVVDNGAKAVEAVQAGAFDLVLMDMQMPLMDGLAATRLLRAFERAHPERPRTAVAMLSANAMTHHRDAAATAGADVHIAKPVTARALIAGVEQALSLNAQGDAADPQRVLV